MDMLQRLEVSIPIIQAPMAGVSTPALAAAVSNAGGLGSLGLGASSVGDAGEMIAELRARTSRPFNANVFVHAPPTPDPVRAQAWIEALTPLFKEFDARPPPDLCSPYTSFADDAMLALLVETAPPVVSFHFGLPSRPRLARLREAGCMLFAHVTSPAEAALARAAGVDALVAQGYEAGGHRGVFDPAAPDDRLGVMALTRLLTAQARTPVIAAGAIMDGRGVRAALDLGAVAAQMGTAFIACPESAASVGYRAALAGSGAEHTVMTAAISGRLARCLANRFTRWGCATSAVPPDYPLAYDAGKALAAAARIAGDDGFGAQWAGQGAPLVRAMPAADLVRIVWEEAGLSAARAHHDVSTP